MPLSPLIPTSLSSSGWSPLSFCAATAIDVPRTGLLCSCRRPSPPLMLLLLLLLLLPPLCRCLCLCYCVCLPQIYVQQYCCCDTLIIPEPVQVFLYWNHPTPPTPFPIYYFRSAKLRTVQTFFCFYETLQRPDLPSFLA